MVLKPRRSLRFSQKLVEKNELEPGFPDVQLRVLNELTFYIL